MAQTETGQQKQRKRMPTQPKGQPMGMHDARKPDPLHPELFMPCRCGGCSFTKHTDRVIKTSVGK